MKKLLKARFVVAPYRNKWHAVSTYRCEGERGVKEYTCANSFVYAVCGATDASATGSARLKSPGYAAAALRVSLRPRARALARAHAHPPLPPPPLSLPPSLSRHRAPHTQRRRSRPRSRASPAAAIVAPAGRRSVASRSRCRRKSLHRTIAPLAEAPGAAALVWLEQELTTRVAAAGEGEDVDGGEAISNSSWESRRGAARIACGLSKPATPRTRK